MLPDRENTETQQQSDDIQARSGADAAKDVRISRRRLLRGGAGAAPLLLTLFSRPVLGGGFSRQCFTPSGFCSMPTSGHAPQYCSGLTPGFWKQPQWYSKWTAPYYPTTENGHSATLFNAVFGLPSPYSNQTTLLQVLGLQGGPPNDVARHIVASLLNVAAGFVPVLTIPQVKAIWTEYYATGYFEPTAGVKWDHSQIVDYLTSTMD